MTNFLLMRHEIILLVLILAMLVLEVATKPSQKKGLINVAIGLFLIHTIIGFFPNESGTLFGGSFRTTGLIHFFKNVLNFGVLIILLQSADWLRDKVADYNKIPEFFILLFSSLLGMNYMISSGDFLMFFIGLELSTLPLIALVAYNSYSEKSTETAIKLILSALQKKLNLILKFAKTAYLCPDAKEVSEKPGFSCFFKSFGKTFLDFWR